MTLPRWLLALAVGVVLVGTATAGGTPAGTTDDAPTVEGVVAATASEGIEPDRIVIEVALQADGSARLSIARRVRLDDPAVRQGFERTRQRLRANRSAFREPFARQVRAMATEAEEATGRTMVVENVSVEAERRELPQEYGVVEYSFRWYGFAATDERLRAGDALSELFLDANTTLLVSWPDDAALAEVSPPPDERRDRAVVWSGPLEFAPSEPRVVLESGSLSFGPDLSVPNRSNDVLVTLLALGLVVGAVGAGLVVWRRRRADTDASVAPAPTPGASPNAETAGGTPPGADGEDTEPAEADTDDQAAGAAPSADLLSNEEQVLALLDDEGGRMKQQDVVSELDWSETKTSEVVSDLREADEIEVYRLGRENVLALPDTGLGIDSGEDDE